MVQNLQINSPLTPLIVAGDFNAYEFTDGYVDVVGEIKGQVNPNDNVLSSNGSSIVNPVLTNSVDTMIDEEKYSVNLFGNTEARDHALFNDAALIKLSHVQYLRGNSDAPAYLREDHSQLLGLSDHDALVIYLDLLDPSDLIFRNRFE
jgi:predicted extracellular nuclease